MSGPLCGPNHHVITAIFSIIEDGLNPTAAAATVAFVEDRLTPVKDQIVNELLPLSIIPFIIIFIVTFFLIIFILWASYELGISSWIVAAVIILIIIIAV